MMCLERRDMQRDLGNNEDTTEGSDEGPERNHQVTNSLRRLIPSISEEMRDRTRQPAPWWSGQIRVQIGIYIEVPAREVKAFRGGWCVLRLVHHD